MKANASAIRLIVGLGNPGRAYADTRHNAGRWFIARMQAADGFTLSAKKKLNAELGESAIGGGAVRVMAPTGFMNLSGQAVAAVAAFYRIPPPQILIAHDDLDLPPGCARLKRGGGHGGHNGLRDIISQLGSRDFLRLRLGIGHPGAPSQVTGYVLTRPAAEQRAHIDAAIGCAMEALDETIAGHLETAMTRLHTATAPPRKPARQHGFQHRHLQPA